MKGLNYMANKKKDLMNYRLDAAKDRLQSSKILLDHKNYKDSIGRSYYAMFTAVRAILAMDGEDFSKHSSVIVQPASSKAPFSMTLNWFS